MCRGRMAGIWRPFGCRRPRVGPDPRRGAQLQGPRVPFLSPPLPHPTPRHITLPEARSRLYQHRFWQPNIHFSAVFEIYKII